MEILFKSNDKYFFIVNNRLDWKYINPTIDLSNITHLGDAEVLYHYRDTKHDIKSPVYYEYNGRAIVKSGSMYGIIVVDARYTKDYTITNLKLI